MNIYIDIENLTINVFHHLRCAFFSTTVTWVLQECLPINNTWMCLYGCVVPWGELQRDDVCVATVHLGLPLVFHLMNFAVSLLRGLTKSLGYGIHFFFKQPSHWPLPASLNECWGDGFPLSFSVFAFSPDKTQRRLKCQRVPLVWVMIC